MEPLCDGALPIPPNHKIPQILILTFPHRNKRGQDRCRSWPSRARGRNAPGPVSRPRQPVRLSDRRYATDRDLTREMPLVVPRDQRNHFLPPVMTTVFPSGCGGRGFRLQPRHLEYRLYDLAILVNHGPFEFSKFTQTRQHLTSRCRRALCYNELVTGNGSLSPVVSHNLLPPGSFLISPARHSEPTG